MPLVGAPFTRKIRKVVRAKSAAAAIRLLRKRIAVTTADDYGAINAYDQKDGKYRCEAYRWLQVVDSQVFDSLSQVRHWWVKWQRLITERPDERKA